ncbi:MAG: hypothetical protein ACJA1H_002836 [Glaciecola sp.]|jgi:hypothetical protein
MLNPIIRANHTNNTPLKKGLNFILNTHEDTKIPAFLSGRIKLFTKDFSGIILYFK